MHGEVVVTGPTMRWVRRFVGGLLIAAGGMPVLAEPAFPSRPVTILVPYPPGGALDAFVRSLADALRPVWKAAVVIDNRPGANEMIAAAALAKARPDGYTLMASTEAAAILNPLLFAKLPYDAQKDLAPVSILVRVPLVLAVPADSPAGTLKEFIAMARSRAGDPVRYGSSSPGGTGHLPFIQLASDHRLQLVHVPYRGGGPLLQDLLGGHVEAGLLGSAVAEPHIKAGRIKGLAVTADRRLDSLPMVPTYQELGVPDLEATFIVALSAPAGTPPAVIEAIALAARRVLQDPDFQRKSLKPFGFVAVGSDAAAYREYIRTETDTQRKRIDAGGIKLEM